MYGTLILCDACKRTRGTFCVQDIFFKAKISITDNTSDVRFAFISLLPVNLKGENYIVFRKILFARDFAINGDGSLDQEERESICSSIVHRVRRNVRLNIDLFVTSSTDDVCFVVKSNDVAVRFW